MSGKRWVVLEPPATPNGAGDGAAEPSAEAQFVKDAFSALAFFFLFLWLFWHRLWLAGIAVLALYAAIAMIGWWEGFGFLAWAAQTGLALLVGLEARNLLISKRLRNGWRTSSVLYADSRADAELRYYHQDDLSEGHDRKLGRPLPRNADSSNAAPLPWGNPAS